MAQPHRIVRVGPKSEQQRRFLASGADWKLYGGAAGGGKTAALLLDGLHSARLPLARLMYMRRASKDHAMAGGMWDQAQRIWLPTGARPVKSPKRSFTWPSGARADFDYPEPGGNYEQQFQGLEASQVCFDETTHFPYDIVSYLWGRCRIQPGRRASIAMSCNPHPDHWLRAFVDWYLDAEGYPDMSRSGVVRYFVRHPDSDELVWGGTRLEVCEAANVEPGRVTSFAFFPAFAQDNPCVPDDYAFRLASTRVREEQLAKGNWNAREDSAGPFRESLWRVVLPSDVPPLDWRVRGWDRAATRPNPENKDPDFTAGVLVGGTADGRVYVGLGDNGFLAMRDNAPDVVAAMRLQAIADGPAVVQSIPIDPGNAGKESQVWTRERMRDPRIGRLHFWVQTKNKITRASPLAEAARKGKLYLVAGPWFSRAYRDPYYKGTLGSLFWSQVNPFPDGGHDDAVDAMAGAYKTYREQAALFSGGKAETWGALAERLRRGR